MQKTLLDGANDMSEIVSANDMSEIVNMENGFSVKKAPKTCVVRIIRFCSHFASVMKELNIVFWTSTVSIFNRNMRELEREF